jgi:hypothetical protein
MVVLVLLVVEESSSRNAYACDQGLCRDGYCGKVIYEMVEKTRDELPVVRRSSTAVAPRPCYAERCMRREGGVEVGLACAQTLTSYIVHLNGERDRKVDGCDLHPSQRIVYTVIAIKAMQ